MSDIAWARRRYEWKLRVRRWRDGVASAVVGLTRIPKAVLAVGMLALGSLIGAVGPFLLQEHARTRAATEAREKLLDTIIYESSITEDIVSRYAQALESQASHKVQTQLRELSIREDMRAGLITTVEADKELDRVAIQTNQANARFDEVRRAHDQQLDRFAAWHVGALLEFKRRFPHHAAAADAAFSTASTNIQKYRTLASDRAIAHEIVAALHEDRVRAAFLDMRAKRISRDEYRWRIAESANIKVGGKTSRLALDLSALKRLVAAAKQEDDASM